MPMRSNLNFLFNFELILTLIEALMTTSIIMASLNSNYVAKRFISM